MAAVRDPLVSFVWGKGGAALTPEEIAQQRELESAVRAKGIDTSPVGHWTQGAARVADAIAGAFQRGNLDKASNENATYNEGIISSLLKGNAPASTTSGATSSIPASGASAEMAATSPDMQQYRDAIAGIESAGSGDYAAIGPTNDKLGRALGRYQIMEANIGPWSQAALGRAVTPDEFMADPKLQDTIFDHQFGQYVQKYGPEGAAQAWLGGEGGVGKVGREDVLGTSIGEYGQRFSSAIGNDAQGAIEAVAPTEGGSLADEVASFEQTPGYAAQFPGQDIAAQQAAQQPVAQSQAVQQVAQVLPAAGQGQQADPVMNEALIRAISDPRATAQTKAIAQALMQQQMAQQQAAQEMRMKQADPAYQVGLEKSRLEVENLRNPRLTPGDKLAREKFDLERGQQGKTADINEYEYAKERGYEGSFVDFQLAQKKAAASSTNVNVGEGDKFYENLDKKNAETFAALSDSGMQARGKLAQIDRLEGLMQNAPQGAIGALKLAAGEYGIATEGLSDIQAAQALINELVPQQRQPGSGPMSDADLALFKRSLPRVLNQAGGNQLIFQTMRGIAQYQTQMGDIADQVANREIMPAEGRKMIQALKNPLADFKIPDGKTENQSGGPARPQTDEEFNALPSGAMFVDPDDGNIYRKP